ncbi:hypothetical protein [Sporohalobacter salinus]|uniref:hypothetical protein n=1 Tax=Sporohalobacter salinus TaxID=1494606 RepID=UPI001961A3DA|nr:hypothetical protein [Sporohalobacter salinus]MBM7624110.1 hypothetical protein [Sporohalobacter salinus]
MRKKLIPVVVTVLVVITSSPLQAVDLSYGGQVNSYLEQYEEEGTNYFTSLTELKLKLTGQLANWSFHFDGSLNLDEQEMEGWADYSPEGDTELNKLYFNLWLPKGEVKVGKQRIAWGSGYFFNPTDIINPIDDNSKVSSRQSKSKRNTNSVYGMYYLPQGTLEGVIVTDFQEIGPGTEKEANSYINQINPLFSGEIKLPNGFNEEKEWALKYSTLINNFDVALNYYQGREDHPVPQINPRKRKVILSYPEKKMIGFDTAGTLDDVGVWGEASYSFPDKGDNYSQIIIGMDYTFATGIHLLGEYYRDESLGNYTVKEVTEKDFITLRSDYDLTDSIEISGNGIFSLESDFTGLAGKVTYSYTQDIELKVGVNKLINEEGTVFASESSLLPFKNKIYFKGTYYF